MRPTTPLKRLALVAAGQSPPSEHVTDFDGDGIPFIQGNAEFGAISPTPRFQCDTAPKRARSGDILVSVRAPVGALNIADRIYGIGRGLASIRPLGALTQRFLWWFMHASVGPLRAMGSGSTYEAVSTEDIGSLMVPTLALQQQRVIADFLDAETARIDAVLAAKARLAASLDERLRAARDSRFAALTAPRAPLGRFVLSLTQGVSPQAGERPAEVGERGLLKLSAVKRGSFVDGENKVLDPGVVDGAMTVARDDLLVTRSNTPSYVGDACWVPDNFPHLVICDLIYRLRLDQRLRPDFAAQVLVSEAGHGELSSLARGTSQSMVKLRGEDIKSVRVPIPAVEDQIKFMTVVNSMRAAHEAIHGKLRMQSAALQEHRQALITAAVTGELDIPGAA